MTRNAAISPQSNSGPRAGRGRSDGGSARETLRTYPFFLSNRFFIIFGLASALLIPARAWWPSGFGPVLALDAILVIAALIDYFSGPSARSVQAERLLLYPLAVGRANEIPLEIFNSSDRTVTVLAQDDIPDIPQVPAPLVRVSVKPRSRVRASYRLTPIARGAARFGRLHFWVQGPMGLVWKHHVASAEQEIPMYPGLDLIEKRRLRGRPMSPHELIRPISTHGAGADFDSLREYVQGDDIRLIHWGTSARKGSLVVRQNRAERGQTIVLALDAGRMMTARLKDKTKFDHALEAAILLAYAALDAGDKVGLMVVGMDVLLFLPPAPGHAQFGRILEATHAITPRMEEPRFHAALSDFHSRVRRRSLVVVFTDLIDERASQGLTRFLIGLLPRHMPLVAAVSDPDLTRVADGIPHDFTDLYRQGVAAELLERRNALLAKLSASGVMVMDANPETFAAETLDRYLRIKARNLL